MQQGMAALAQLLGEGATEAEDKLFDGDLASEIEILKGVFAAHSEPQNFRPGEIIRMRREWRSNSRLSNWPCVVLQKIDPPVEGFRANGNDARALHSTGAAGTLDLLVGVRIDGDLEDWLIDSRKFERVGA